MEKIITCSVAGCTREFPRKKVSPVSSARIMVNDP